LNPVLQAQLDQLNALVTLIESLQRHAWYMVPRTDEAKSAGHWSRYADLLAGALRKAMRSTNPGLELGISNDNPVVRFIAAIAPHITDERPTVAAVAQHLKRVRRQGRDSQN
jgi:hypothetical protein